MFGGVQLHLITTICQININRQQDTSEHSHSLPSRYQPLQQTLLAKTAHRHPAPSPHSPTQARTTNSSSTVPATTCQLTGMVVYRPQQPQHTTSTPVHVCCRSCLLVVPPCCHGCESPVPCSNASASLMATSSSASGALVNRVAGYTALPQRGCRTICSRRQMLRQRQGGGTKVLFKGVHCNVACGRGEDDTPFSLSAQLLELQILCAVAQQHSLLTLQQPAFCVLKPSSSDRPSTSGYTLLVPCWIICNTTQHNTAREGTWM